MKRQIVQIAALPAVSGYHSDALYALCGDGGVWAFDGKWNLLPPIPQDPEAPEVTELRKFVEGNGSE
jgi:hypothetical protein